MFRLETGILKMDNYDLDHIKGWIEEDNYSPKEALQFELEGVGIDIREVSSIELTGSQMSNKDYCDVYAKIVCDFWNSK